MSEEVNEAAAQAVESGSETKGLPPHIVEGLAKRPHFKRTSWLEATVDLSGFGLGKVFLRDARYDRLADWLESCRTRGEHAVESAARLLCAYVDRSEVPGMPARNSDPKTWETWVKQQRGKPILVLRDAAVFFSEVLAAADAIVPN